MNNNNFQQVWWNNNLSDTDTYQLYLKWIGDHDSESRKFFRDNFIKKLNIKSMADFGCGPCIDYQGLRLELYDIEYLGIDSCKHLESINVNNNINFLYSPIETTPIEDNKYELSYSRHVLEHLPSFETALSEMIRVSSKYVAHIFFIKPTVISKINYDENTKLYHNQYSIFNIEQFLSHNSKVSKFTWTNINNDENILFINLK